MLSVCLPVYRYDARALVRELLRQAAALPEVDFEVLVYDDASPDDGDWGRAELRATAGIRYVELPENLGRAAIRNRMVRDAARPFVVLMDADGWPNREFLERWVDAVITLQIDHPDFVSTGGRLYAPDPPDDAALHLHWRYGTKRESRSLARREREGWLGFQSNNFMAPRRLLLAHPFPENSIGYGHEDTWWGQRFVGSEVQLFPWQNLVIHLGLEPTDVFLAKQRQAIRNLRLLKNEHPHLRTRLTDLVEKLPFLLKPANLIPEKILIRHLTNRARPNLYVLDLLKLRWWATNRPIDQNTIPPAINYP